MDRVPDRQLADGNTNPNRPTPNRDSNPNGNTDIWDANPNQNPNANCTTWWRDRLSDPARSRV